MSRLIKSSELPLFLASLKTDFMASLKSPQRVEQITSQSSGIGIKGNNNDVTVNEQVKNNVGGQNSGSGYGHGDILLGCVILCSNIRVN